MVFDDDNEKEEDDSDAETPPLPVAAGGDCFNRFEEDEEEVSTFFNII